MRLKTIDPRIGDVFYGANLAEAIRIKMEEEEFDRVIERRNINPKEMVRGWVCLEVPDKYLGEEKKQKLEWRFYMRNNQGIESTTICDSLEHPTFQRNSWTMGQRRDISRLRQIPYTYYTY